MNADEPDPFADPWVWRSEAEIYENPWIRVVERRGRAPDGAPALYGIVRFKNRAIGIIPVLADGAIALVGQFRVPLDRYSWEIPEGGGPAAETPRQSAERELAEETGFTAGHWREILRTDLSNSVTDETGFVFLATELRPGPARPEGNERLQHKTMRLREALTAVASGAITDSLTQLALLRLYHLAVTGELGADFAATLLN